MIERGSNYVTTRMLNFLGYNDIFNDTMEGTDFCFINLANKHIKKQKYSITKSC